MKYMLEVKNLTAEIKIKNQSYPVLDHLNLTLKAGETLGIVGESGCGKSLTSLAIMGLLPKDVVTVTEGEILFANQNLLQASSRQMQRIRGNDMAMIFQDPISSLNPVLRIGKQVEEVMRCHLKLGKREAKERSIELLRNFGIKNPRLIYDNYPFQLSGGMCQRVMIAMSMACNPRVLIADEPTTALDVTLQAQILEMMNELKATHQTSVIMISHNLGVIAKTCDRLHVMYRGQIVESGTIEQLFAHPAHPYTKALFECIPTLSAASSPLQGIPLSVPPLDQMLAGCYFAERCRYAQSACRKQPVSLQEVEPGHTSRCLYGSIGS